LSRANGEEGPVTHHAREGERFTSSSQGLRSVSMSTSKPYSSARQGGTPSRDKLQHTSVFQRVCVCVRACVWEPAFVRACVFLRVCVCVHGVRAREIWVLCLFLKAMIRAHQPESQRVHSVTRAPSVTNLCSRLSQRGPFCLSAPDYTHITSNIQSLTRQAYIKVRY